MVNSRPKSLSFNPSSSGTYKDLDSSERIDQRGGTGHHFQSIEAILDSNPTVGVVGHARNEVWVMAPKQPTASRFV